MPTKTSFFPGLHKSRMLINLHTAMQQDAWLDSIPEYSMHDFRSQHNARKICEPSSRNLESLRLCQ